MNTLTIDLPPGIDADRARLLLAIRLFEEGDVSLGCAAEMADFSIRTFMELLAKRGISIARYPEDELDKEVAAPSTAEPGDKL